MRTYCYLSAALLFLAACNNPQNPRTINLGPTSLPPPPPAQLACVHFAKPGHEDLPVLTAALEHPDVVQFAEFMLSLETLDPNAYESLFRESRAGFSLLLPTNYAFARFQEQYDLSKLSKDRRIALIKSHILVERAWYRDLFDGQKYASNMHSYSTRFSKNQEDCVIVNGSAEFLVVEDICFNGLVYEIDQVLIPDDGL